MPKTKKAEDEGNLSFDKNDDGSYMVRIGDGDPVGRVSQTDEGWFSLAGHVRSGPFETRGAAAEVFAPL